MVERGGTTIEVEVVPQDPESTPPLDPHAVERAYLLHRARRRARFEHHREKRRAGVRFWFVVLVLVGASLALAALIVQEVQRLFGV